MKLVTSSKEFENALIELRSEAKNNGYDFFKFYLVGEQLIKEKALQCNMRISFGKGFDGLFRDADRNVQGLSLSNSKELEFVDVAFIEGAINGKYLAIDSIFKVVKYKDYLLRPFKYYNEKTYHFEFLENPINIKVRTKKPNKVSVLTDKKADAWVSALLEDIRQSAIAKQAADQECGKDCYTLIGEIIKARREELNLSQRQLAEMLCTNRPNVANYELGKRGMSVQTLLKYCKVLKIKLKLNGVTIK